jgi:hypothetical protein
MPRRATTASPTRALSDFSGPADALLDHLVPTMHLRFEQVPAGEIGALRSALARAGVVGPGGRARSDAAFGRTCPYSGAPVSLGVHLTLVSGAGGVAVTGGGSRLGVNPLLLLRAQVEPVCGRGLDGGLNVVGPPAEDRPRLLGLHLATVSWLVDAFLAACAAASPVSAEFWVGKAELNRDLPRAHAPELAHRIAADPGPLHGAVGVRHYSGAPDTALDRNYVTVTWRNDNAAAPVRRKFYAKTEDLLRIEVCFDNREAVLLGVRWASLDWPDGAAVDGAGVANRLGVLALASAPLLDEMLAHVARLDEPMLETLDLLVALAPLTKAAATPPGRRAGGRPAEGTKAQVREVLYHLLAVGRFDASALKTDGTARKALRQIAGEGGLLAGSRDRAPLYTLPLRFSDARAALRRAIWPEAADAGRRLRRAGDPTVRDTIAD